MVSVKDAWIFVGLCCLQLLVPAILWSQRRYPTCGQNDWLAWNRTLICMGKYMQITSWRRSWWPSALTH